MLCLIMLMSMTRLRRSLINRITRHVFLIVIRLRRIRRRLVIIRLIVLCLRMAFHLMVALAVCISRQYSPHPLQLLSSTGCYLSVRCAGTQDWVLLAVVGPYTRMVMCGRGGGVRGVGRAVLVSVCWITVRGCVCRVCVYLLVAVWFRFSMVQYTLGKDAKAPMVVMLVVVIVVLVNCTRSPIPTGNPLLHSVPTTMFPSSFPRHCAR